jgi:hypothetical protein
LLLRRIGERPIAEVLHVTSPATSPVTPATIEWERTSKAGKAVRCNALPAFSFGKHLLFYEWIKERGWGK